MLAGTYRYFFFSVVLALLAMSLKTNAKDRPESAPPALTVDEALYWLPANTETIIVAQGPFELRPIEPAKESEFPPMDKTLQTFACGPVVSSGEVTARKSLEGLPIAFVLEGARGFRSPQGLGLMPYDGCNIIVFKDELKTAKDDFIKALNSESPKEEQIAGQKTFVFQKKLEQDQWKFYIAFPRPNVILGATDRSYLEEVLKRMAMKDKPAERALPENLAEWKHVDRKVKFWGIRHYDKANAKNDPSSPLTNESGAWNTPDPDAIGLVFAYDAGKKNLVNIKYLSTSKRADEIAAMDWTHEQEGLKPQIRQKTKGVVEISVELNGENKGVFFLVFLAALGHGIYI
jgi:hypothetical protein